MSSRQAGMPQQANGGAVGSIGGTIMPDGAEPTASVQEIFISPRVIDRRAYSELAAELRDMIDRAAAERVALTAMLDQAGKAVREMRDREAAQQGNMELAVRALKSIDDKAARVEQLVVKAADQSRAFERIEAQAGGIVEAKLSVLDARVQAITSAATSKTEALEERVRQASKELEQRIDAIRRDAQSIAAPVQDGLLRLCERATALINASAASGGLGELVSRAEGVRDAAESIVSRLEAAKERAERDRATIDSWCESAEKKTEAIAHRQRELETQSAGLFESTERNLEIIKSTIDRQQLDVTEKAQRAIDDLQAKIAELQMQAQRAGMEGERVLGEIRPAADVAILELRQAIEQSRDVTNSSGVAMRLLDKSALQVRDLLARLEPWKGVLEGDGALPEPLERMIHGVRSELGTIAGALRGAAERAERATATPAVATQAVRTGATVGQIRRVEAMNGAD